MTGKGKTPAARMRWRVTVADGAGNVTAALFELASDANVYARAMAERFGYDVTVEEVS